MLPGALVAVLLGARSTRTLGLKMTTFSTSLFIVVVASCLTACSDKSVRESEVYTLYSSNYPTDDGRSGVATFDLASIPELNGQICQEAADLYQADFEKRKRESGLSATVKMRYWCEKGRFKK